MDLLQQRHEIRRKQTSPRRHLHALVDARLLEQVDELVPRHQRSRFVESVLRRELKELQAS